MAAGPNDDALEGGAGNDTLLGGDGVDTAVFSGSFLEYRLSAEGDDGWTIAHRQGTGVDGRNELLSIEQVFFADRVVNLHVEAEAAGMRSISTDGHFIVFASDATDLVAGDTNGIRDIFVADTWTGAVTRARTDAAGGQAMAEGHSYQAHGWHFFDYEYVWLGPDDVVVIEIHNSGRTETVTDTFYGASDEAVISSDGRYVGFASDAANLVPGDGNATIWDSVDQHSSINGHQWVEWYHTDFSRDIFVKDLQTGGIVRANTDATGLPAHAESDSWAPRLSADGRYIGFLSDAGNLVTGDAWNSIDAFVKDLQTGAIVRVGDPDAEELVTAAGFGEVDWWTAA